MICHSNWHDLWAQLSNIWNSARRDRYENTSWRNGVMHLQKPPWRNKNRETLWVRLCVFDRSHLLREISKQIYLKIKQRALEVLQEVIFFLILLHHRSLETPGFTQTLRRMDIWTEDTFHFIRLSTSCVTKQILQTWFWINYLAEFVDISFRIFTSKSWKTALHSEFSQLARASGRNANISSDICIMPEEGGGLTLKWLLSFGSHNHPTYIYRDKTLTITY